MKSLKHVAIIMDGNGRWGQKKKKRRYYGHIQGLKTLENIVNYTLKKNINFLTLFVFSTENWKRPLEEINFLFSLLEKFLDKKVNILNKKNNSGKVIIEYKDLEQFDLISDLLTRK